MTSRTHDLIGLASLLTLAAHFPPGSLNMTTGFACAIGNSLGSLVPDIDQASNNLWDILPAGNFLGKILRHLLLGHRTLSHSILGTFLFYKILTLVIPKLFNPAYVDNKLLLVAIMAGFVSHIIADSFTKDGIPLFFPLKVKIGIPPIAALRITAGKWVEKLLVFPGVVVYLVWLISTQKEAFLFLVKLINN
jgi:inner membrane protein